MNTRHCMLLLLVLATLGLGELARVSESPFHLRANFHGDLVRLEAGKVEKNEALFVDMPIDHFNDKKSLTFKNRYWINDTYYKPGGPVFLFDSGEQNAEPLLPYYLQEFHGLSATMQLAKRFNGIAILWEHRYYGASLPFPVNPNTTAEQWQFLTTDQALQDVVFFATSFPRRDNATHRALHPSVTPWIWLGGSYPGVRGALMRVRNPEVIFATWASSAPVHAQIDMASYYATAARSMPSNCSSDWAVVTRYVDDVLKNATANSEAAIEVKFELQFALLSGKGGDTSRARNLTREEAAKISELDAAQILMTPLSFYQYYGPVTIPPFCDLLETHNDTRRASSRGVAHDFGVGAAYDAFRVALAESDYDSIPSSPDDPVQDRSWMYQYCTEYGFYQRGDPSDPDSIETSFLSLDLFQAQCNATFSRPGGLPLGPPRVENVNKYGGWEMNPSNVFWTNGEFDPWRTMSLASIEPNSPQRKPSTAIPACNTPPRYPSFFGVTHPDAVHVTDMRVLLTPDVNHTNFQTVGFFSPLDPEAFYGGLDLFGRALEGWLHCF